MPKAYLRYCPGLLVGLNFWIHFVAQNKTYVLNTVNIMISELTQITSFSMRLADALNTYGTPSHCTVTLFRRAPAVRPRIPMQCSHIFKMSTNIFGVSVYFG